MSPMKHVEVSGGFRIMHVGFRWVSDEACQGLRWVSDPACWSPIRHVGLRSGMSVMIRHVGLRWVSANNNIFVISYYYSYYLLF